MPTPAPSARKSGNARFGVFKADFAARELRKHGQRIRLQDQPFAVLAFLLERAGDIVTREELRAHLWPADTFVDFDHSLNTAVNKLREVLGDSAGNPRFIETLPRRGYRFLAEVQWEGDSNVDSKASGTAADTVSELPQANRTVLRALFGSIQLMYLIFYVEALVHWQGVDHISWLNISVPVVLVIVLVTAGVGIALRLYLLSAVAFDYARLGESFRKIFLPVFALDELWAIAPFLLLKQIGFGPAFGATAALLYVPFAERTLIRMAYPKS